MSSEPVEAPKAADGVPEQSLPERPAKQPKEKKEKAPKEKSAHKGSKASGLEVCAPAFPMSEDACS
jgi:threonyl-tRNA synthetase